MVRIKIAALLIFLTLWSSSACLAGDAIPFKIAGQDFTAYSLVAPNASHGQLAGLVGRIRDARRAGNLESLAAEWSVYRQYPHRVLWVLIFTDPAWATSERLHKFMQASLKSKSDTAFSRIFAGHVRAEYFFSDLEEYGNFGYDDGTVRSSGYKKLF